MHRPRAPRSLLVGAVALALVGSAQLAPPSAVVLTASEPVPNVVGRTQAAATKIILGWQPSPGGSARPEFTPTSPPQGAEGVAIVVRQGAAFDDPGEVDAVEHLVVPLTLGVIMPALTDRSRGVAEQLLARFALTDVTWKPPEAALDATVVSQSPTRGSLVGFLDPVVVSFADVVPVPNVVGQPATQARRTLERAGLLINPRGGEGRVTAQQPPAGTLVAGGSTVSVTLPATPGLTVPNLVGLTFGEARQAVDQAGLRLAPVDSLDDRRRFGVGDRRLVTGQRPTAGTPAQHGDVVTVTFAPATAQVPNLIGLRAGQARDRVAAAGLRLDSPDGRGSVDSQQPRAGARVVAGSRVTVTLDVGLRVPNLLGLTVDQARTSLARLDLDLDAPDGDGRILQQNPPADTPAEPGDTVTVQLVAATGNDPARAVLLLAGGLLIALLAGAAGAHQVRERRPRRWVSQHVQVRSGRVPRQMPWPPAPTEPALRVRVETRTGPEHGHQ